MKTLKNSSLFFNKKQMSVLLLTLMVSMTGCMNQTQTKSSVEVRHCTMPHSKQLIVAVEESRSALNNLQCQMDYKQHFSTLVDIAAGSPDAANLNILGTQSQWMVRKGIITKRESEAMLRRYFSPQMVSLEYDSDFNTYSHCSMGTKQDAMIMALKQEMDQKRRGIALALGDNPTYQTAMKEFQTAELLLESTHSACQTQH